MKKEDLLLLILTLLLLAAMLWTLFFGGENSRHGVGGRHAVLPGNYRASVFPDLSPLFRENHSVPGKQWKM